MDSWHETRLRVLERDGYRCQKCGLDLSGDWDKPTVHHLTPRFRGGKDTLDNLICLCVECHTKIHQVDRPRSGLRGFNAITA